MEACDNLNDTTGERAWNHRTQQCVGYGFKIYLAVGMGSAPWLDVGGEEETEIKDKTQVPRKNV